MWASTFGFMSVVPWICFAQISGEPNPAPVIVAASPGDGVPLAVHDRADVFSDGAKGLATNDLERLGREHRVPILVETVESLGGAAIDASARVQARPAGAADGIYVLVAELERDVGVVLGPSITNGPRSDRDRSVIREAFLKPFRAGDADRGLKEGVRVIADTLESAAAETDRAAARTMLGSGDPVESIFPLVALVGLLVAVLVAARTYSTLPPSPQLIKPRTSIGSRHWMHWISGTPERFLRR